MRLITARDRAWGLHCPGSWSLWPSARVDGSGEVCRAWHVVSAGSAWVCKVVLGTAGMSKCGQSALDGAASALTRCSPGREHATNLHASLTRYVCELLKCSALQLRLLQLLKRQCAIHRCFSTAATCLLLLSVPLCCTLGVVILDVSGAWCGHIYGLTGVISVVHASGAGGQ
jgi:hypothetical protein